LAFFEVGYTGELEDFVNGSVDGNSVRRKPCSSIGRSAVVERIAARTGPAAAALQGVFVVAVEEGVIAKDGLGRT
jgi:hypothetical protein